MKKSETDEKIEKYTLKNELEKTKITKEKFIKRYMKPALTSELKSCLATIKK